MTVKDALLFECLTELSHGVGPIIDATYQPPFSNLLTHFFVFNLAELKERKMHNWIVPPKRSLHVYVLLLTLPGTLL